MVHSGNITISLTLQALKNGSEVYLLYPGLANELRATLLSVSMSSISASVPRIDVWTLLCRNDTLASGNVIELGTNVSQYQCL